MVSLLSLRFSATMGDEDLEMMGVAGNMIIGKARGFTFRVRTGCTPTPKIRSPLRVGDIMSCRPTSPVADWPRLLL